MLFLAVWFCQLVWAADSVCLADFSLSPLPVLTGPAVFRACQQLCGILCVIAVTSFSFR